MAGGPIIFQKSVEVSGRNQVEISLLLPTLILPASGIWDEPRIVHEASDRHRVLLLPESVFIYSFLLVQLTCLVSEFFPPVFPTPGQGLSVVGSCGCGWQAAGDRLGEMRLLFLLWLLIFALFFLRLVLIVNSKWSQHQVIRRVIKAG